MVLATATRGNGGQNEIGPELFESLGVLRTEELLAAHHYDGAEQFFARAVDFGYSFSVDETFEKWGRREIVGDYVRLIRMTRPDVMLTMVVRYAMGEVGYLSVRRHLLMRSPLLGIRLFITALLQRHVTSDGSSSIGDANPPSPVGAR